jgi:HSP20 family protein
MMTLWKPFNDLLRDDDFWSLGRVAPSGPARAVMQPAVDIVEDKSAFVLHVELPGIQAEEVDISVDGNVLTIKGERKAEHEQTEGEGYRRIERRYGSFQRSFSLPDTVDGSAIEASMQNGILNVRLPKREAAVPRKIEVKAAGSKESGQKLFSDNSGEQATA